MTSIIRAGHLTWPQQRMWMRLRWRQFEGTYPILKFSWQFSQRIDARAAERAWGVLVERHEILRTLFVSGTDNRPVQVVLTARDFRPPVSMASVEELADYQARPPEFLFGSGSPAQPLWHARMFTEGSDIKAVTITAEHIICDGFGILNWQNQFVDICLGRDTTSIVTQPLDRLSAEHALTARSDAIEPKLQRYRSVIEAAPQILLPARPHGEDRYLFIHAKFANILPQVDAICLEYRCSRVAVMAFVLGFLLSGYAGRDAIFAENLFFNRRDSDASIDCQMLPVWQIFEFGDSISLIDAMKQIFITALDTYATGVFNELLVLELRARVAAGRGILAPRALIFNYTGQNAPNKNAEIPPPTASIASAEVVKQRSRSGVPYSNSFQIWDGAAFEVGFDIDTALISESAADEIIQVIPNLVHLMRSKPTATIKQARSEVRIMPADLSDCVMIDRNWIRLESLVRLLKTQASVVDADCTVEDGRLTALIVLDSIDTSIADIDEYVRSQLNEHTDVMAPHRYVVSFEGRSPHETVTIVAAEIFRDRDHDGPEPRTPWERELAQAFAEVHGVPLPDIARSYVGAGGELLLAPAVVDVLRRQGYRGLRRWHFDSGISLRAMAQSLTVRASWD